MDVKGLGFHVYKPIKYIRDGTDCTNGGISTKFDELIVVGEDLKGYIDISLSDPPENAVFIVKRHLFGRDVYHAEPMDGLHAMKFRGLTGGKWYCDGGNYIATSDSRFGEACGGFYGALSLHDRCEW